MTETRTVTGASHWRGSFLEGAGEISTASDTLTAVPYSYASRFQGAPGACPEELLAAAHAACINHAIANILRLNGRTLDSVETRAELTMGPDAQGYPAILGIHFEVEVTAPGLTEDQLKDFTERARTGCAFSKALRVPLTLDARLMA